MLYRLERALRSEGCVRAMFSIPSPRLRLAKWLNYQSYDRIGGMPYPFKYLDHVLTSEDITLDMYAKSLAVEAEAASIDDTAQRKEDRPQQKNMHLPPHWRGVRSTADILGAATVDINVDALMQSQCNDIVRGTESDDGSLDNDSFDIPDVD